MKKIFGFIFVFVAVRLLAVNPVPYIEGTSFTFKIAGTGSGTMTVYDESGTQAVSASASGTTVESGAATAWLRPGKTYALNFAASGPTGYWLSFIAPSGYAVYVNSVETNLVAQSPGGGSYSHDYVLEIRPMGATAGGDWGSFSGIAVGKSIAWSVGLGDLRTGRSAGGIQFREPDLSNSPATRDRLYYLAPPANLGQITFIKDGPSNQRLRQIVTPIGFTDLVDVSGGYEIRCYVWSQAAWTGSIYTFTGSPWKTIKVESPGADQLKITETEGSVVRVSQLTGTGCMGVSGGAITTSGTYTIHTFNSSGALTVAGSLSSNVDYLVVGGGGGGGSGTAGGGGGGGSVEYLTGQSLSGGAHTVTVGAGGAPDTNGGNSSFHGTTGYGGGCGAGPLGNYYAGSGGSGGGGNANQLGGSAGSGSNVYAGGGGDNGSAGWPGGGGGGAGGNTQNPSQGGGTYNGANGIVNSISGTATYYAAGGGGGNGSTSGGLGGAGYGGPPGSGGYYAASNTGSGGGGSGVWGSWSGGGGGSGVVIVRYPTTSVGNFTWTLQEGDATTVVRTTKHTSTVPASGQRDVVVEVRTGGTTGTIVSKTKYHYVAQAWGEELDSIIADPDTGGAQLTTSYTYYTNAANLGNYRKVKSVTAPTGGWTAYEYYDDWDHRGQLKYQFQPWLDSPSAASSASTTTGRVAYFEYTSADWTGRYTRPTLKEERINNSVVGKTTWSHGDTTGAGEPRAYMTVNSYRDASNYHSDYTEYYRADADPDWAGRKRVSIGADSAAEVVGVDRGTFNTTTKAFTVSSSGDHWREVVVHCSSNGTGADVVSSFDGQAVPTCYAIPYKTTVDVNIRIAQGYLYRSEKWVYSGSGNFSLMTADDFDYDAHGRLTQRWSSTGNGALTGYTYTNGRLTSTVDSTGTETQYSYDQIGRVVTSAKKGASAGSYAAQGDITTTTTYDGASQVTQVVVSGGSLSQTTTSTYDLAGRLTQSVAPGSYTTGISYSSGGRIVTTTLPGGAQKISEVYPDGHAKSQTGSAQVAQYVSYALNTAPGTVTTQVNIGSSTSTNLVKTTADWLGRPLTEVRPGWSGVDTTTSWTYGSTGLLTKLVRPGFADTLYSYDTMGVLFRECLDVGANGTIDLASSDRITEHGWTYFSTGGNWWSRKTTTTYATTNSGTATVVGKIETQLSGLPTNRLSRADTTDIFGNVTSQLVDVNRSGKVLTTTTTYPDSSTSAVQIAYNGLVVSSLDKTNHTTTFGFDALGRPVTSTDPRTGTTTTAYVSGTSQVSTVTDAASIVQSTYTYDSAGRVSSVKDALNKYTYTSYTNRGEVFRQWGDATYPVEYGYDDWGRRTTMNTYRGGTGWTASTWPSSPPTADVTQWNYHQATGLLSSKVSAYGTTDAKTVSYTYTQAGQMATRVWARILSGATHVTTSYAYSSTTGELTSVDYNDSTPDLTYSYNRAGNTAQVTDTTGTRTFNYNLSGTLELQSEDLPTFFGSRRITYPVASSSVIGRPTGLQLGTSGSPTSEQSITYGYDTYGRFNSLAGGGTTLAYAYTSNSNLLASIADSVSGWTQTRTYLSNRDLLDVIETKVSTTSKAKFDYAHDNLGRRTGVNKTGGLYSRYGNGTQGLDTTWGYDDRSQVTAEQTKLGGSSTLLTGRDDAYAWDNIGNRSSTAGTTHNGGAAAYSANALNQYTQRDVVSVFDVAGAAGSGTTVTVNTSSAGVTRHGEYFFKGHSLSNSSGAVFTTLAISDGTTTTNLPAFLAKTAEVFSYDDEGNLTSDGRWDYAYDAENRLVSMQTHGYNATTYAIANADARRLEFTYDYLGRRVEKLVRGGWNGSAFTTVLSDEKFVYSGWPASRRPGEGWNIMAKLNALSSNALMASYYWGLDWSGTLQGAGGVGGLALIVESGSTYLPMFDGNGNVMGLIKASTGSIDAAYEFDAFGNTIRESGTYAASNPFRFSTKYTDVETSLVYYGLRYYSPTLGRFINKDPIEEKGGLNLYGFCLNNGTNNWDLLGMDPLSDFLDEHSPSDAIPDNYVPPGGWGTASVEEIESGKYAPSEGMFQGDGISWLVNGADMRDFGEIGPPTEGPPSSDGNLFGARRTITGRLAGASGSQSSPRVRIGVTSSYVPASNVGTWEPAGVAAAAWNGAYRYLSRFNQNLLNVGQSAVNAAGATAGYLRNLADPGTRDTAVESTTQQLQSLTDHNAWVQYGDYLISPEGLADTAFSVDMALVAGLRPKQCFPEGTLVSTPDGDRKIEELREGDPVWAYNFEVRSAVIRSVKELRRNFTYCWVDVQLEGEVISATRSHPFWSENEMRWVRADQLSAGMRLRMMNDSTCEVVAIKIREVLQPEATFNFEVDVDHNYFVGAGKVLVHNPPPDFIVTPSGTAHAVPAGVDGPFPTRAPGFMFLGGTGGGPGLNSRVTGVRFMDNSGTVTYMNVKGQPVSPTTGNTLSKVDPEWHIPCN